MGGKRETEVTTCDEGHELDSHPQQRQSMWHTPRPAAALGHPAAGGPRNTRGSQWRIYIKKTKKKSNVYSYFFIIEGDLIYCVTLQINYQD